MVQRARHMRPLSTLILVVGTLATACTKVPTQSATTTTSILQPPPLETPTPLPTIAIHDTPTTALGVGAPTPTFAVGQIPPGQYLIFAQGPSGSTGNRAGLDLMDDNGRVIVTFALDIKPSQRVARYGLIYEAYPSGSGILVFDMYSGKTAVVDGTVGCSSPDWSPDGAMIAVSCRDESSSSIRVVTKSGVPVATVLKCASLPDWPAACIAPKWSGDGNAISFERAAPRSGEQDPRDGLYWINTSCIRSVGTCPFTVHGPIRDIHVYSWGPSAHEMAVVRQDHRIDIIDPRVGSAYSHFDIPDAYIFQLAWSPDGKSIAYDNGGDIELLHLASATTSRIFEGFSGGRLGWVIFEP